MMSAFPPCELTITSLRMPDRATSSPNCVQASIRFVAV
jgi:hypothetical protein